MSTIAVFVSDESFRFSPEQLVGHARTQWSAATWVPASGRIAEVAAGTLYVPDAHAPAAAEVTVMRGGRSLDVEGSDDVVIAQFLAHLATAAEFPNEGVEIYEWAAEPVALHPGIDAPRLLAVQE